VTRIYLHPGALLSSLPAPDRRGSGSVSLVSGASDALRHLVDAGHILALVDSLPQGLAESLDVPIETGADLGTADAHGCWLIVGDPEECRSRRRPGLRTMYVGPRRPVGHRPTARCDVEARDLTSAAIEILTQDAMTPASRPG
jgi:hypothetical protein